LSVWTVGKRYAGPPTSKRIGLPHKPEGVGIIKKYEIGETPSISYICLLFFLYLLDKNCKAIH